MSKSSFSYLLSGAAAIALLAPVGSTGVSTAQAQQLALEEIVVTARKRDESVFEIPVSVTAVSDAVLQRAGIDNAQDLSALVPGLDFRQIGDAGRFNPNIRMRGMIQQVITPSTQIGALFWDGSYIGGGGGLVPLGDMERVEVIKGPQTAYFGRNTFAGAINYIPKTAGDEWEGDVSLSWSPTDHDEYNINAGVGGPLGSRMGIRLWAGYDRDGGDFSFDDGEPLGQMRDTSFQATLTYDASEDLRFKLTGYYTDADGTVPGVATLADTPPGSCPIIYRGNVVDVITGELTPFETDLSQSTQRLFCGQLPSNPEFAFTLTRFPTADQVLGGAGSINVLNNLSPYGSTYSILKNPDGSLGEFNRTYRIQLSGEYDFADHTFAYILSSANSGTVTRLDANYGAPSRGVDTIFPFGVDIAVREYYYEARVTSPQDGRLRYLFGTSLYNQHYNNQNFLFIPTAPFDRQRNQTTGIFGSFDYDITDRITLSVEGRYQDESSILIESGNPTLPCGLVTVCNLKNSVDAFLPRVILSYQPMDGATTYVSWSQSKLLGVPTNARFINSIAPEVVSDAAVQAFGDFTQPQKNTQYEFGWKQQWEDWNMTLAVFYIDWKNQPVPAVIFTPSGATSSFRSPGDSEYSGFDLEVNGNITDWLTVNGTIGYNNGVMKNFSNFGSNERVALAAPGLVASNGNPVRNNPEWTGSLSPTIYGVFMDRDWFVRADYFYTGKYFIDYSRYNQNSARTHVNVRAGIDLFEGTQLEVFGNNVFNDLTLPQTSGTTFGPGPGRKTFGNVPQAREYGVRLTASF